MQFYLIFFPIRTLFWCFWGPHIHKEAEVESIHGQQLGRSARDPGSLTLRLVPLLHALPGKLPQRPEVSAVPTGETFQGTAWLIRRILRLWELSPWLERPDFPPTPPRMGPGNENKCPQ